MGSQAENCPALQNTRGCIAVGDNCAVNMMQEGRSEQRCMRLSGVQKLLSGFYFASLEMSRTVRLLNEIGLDVNLQICWTHAW